MHKQTRDSVSVVELRLVDIPRFIAIRRRMLADSPWAFAADPATDRGSNPANLAELIDDPRRAIFVIEQPDYTNAAKNKAEHTQTAPPQNNPTSAAADTTDLPPFVATATVITDNNPKLGHRATIVGVYVDPDYRGKGLGKAVLNAAIDFCKSLKGINSVRLAVSENSPEARKLYESLGFTVWGVEPATVIIDGRAYDEIHMLKAW